MRDLDKALADIVTIRGQLAAGTVFRGFGPAVIAVTGCLAFLTAAAQSVWLDDASGEPLTFFAAWATTAVISGGLIWAEMVARTKRHHSGLADAMLLNAILQFLPAAVAGATLALALMRFAPETLWMLPGLWQIFVSLGIFASVRSLPRMVGVAGAWYLAAGVGVLIAASQDHALSPWSMGLPFAFGQLLLAVILHFASGESDAEN